jgi:hypothetical protein
MFYDTGPRSSYGVVVRYVYAILLPVPMFERSFLEQLLDETVLPYFLSEAAAPLFFSPGANLIKFFRP